MRNACINLVWIQPNFSTAILPVTEPIPKNVKTNIIQLADLNRDADILLWIDKKRLTNTQITQLDQLLEVVPANLIIRDLRDIPDFATLLLPNGQAIFDVASELNEGRPSPASMIWPQVDIARLLAVLHTAKDGYKQIYYTDADVKNLEIRSADIQNIMNHHGCMVCGGFLDDDIENSVLGFRADKIELIQELLKQTVTYIMSSSSQTRYTTETESLNGYIPLNRWAKESLVPALCLEDLSDLTFYPRMLDDTRGDWVDKENRGKGGWKKG